MMFCWDRRYPAQMAQLDRRDATAKRIGRLARDVAMGRFYADAKAKAAVSQPKLDALLAGLPMDALNVLAVLWMVYHPTAEAGATGQGGIWAAASDVVNERARLALRVRPAFEIASGPKRPG